MRLIRLLVTTRPVGLYCGFAVSFLVSLLNIRLPYIILSINEVFVAGVHMLRTVALFIRPTHVIINYLLHVH